MLFISYSKILLNFNGLVKFKRNESCGVTKMKQLSRLKQPLFKRNNNNFMYLL